MCFLASARLAALLALALGLAMPEGTVLAAEEKPVAEPERIIESPLAFDDGALDKLYTELKRTRDPIVAAQLADNVRVALAGTRSATLRLLMDNAARAVDEKRFPAALDFLDQAIVLDRSYVEAWNRRASLHYQMGNPLKSMADVAHVLALEPRHLGALAGMAEILAASGDHQGSAKVWQAYLDLYPADRNAQEKFANELDAATGRKT